MLQLDVEQPSHQPTWCPLQEWKSTDVQIPNFRNDISFMLFLFPPIPEDPTFVIYCSLKQFNCVHLFYSDTAAVSLLGEQSSFNI